MKGLLIVNNFINAEKFYEIYGLLLNASKGLDVTLSLKRSGELPHNIAYLSSLDCDFILFWDKDVLLARMLEQCGHRVFNSADAVYWCDNKGYTAFILDKNGVNTPTTFAAPYTFEGLGYNDLEFTERVIEELGFPMVIKESYGSFGRQVYLARDREEMGRIIGGMGHKEFILQRFIASSSGRDVRVNVVGDRVISSMLRWNTTGDFRSNITNGGEMHIYTATPEQQRIAVDACRALGLDFAGVDVIFGEDDEPMICEVNSNPHFKSSLDCNGIDMGPYILSYVKEKVSGR